jgi:hypothetical protein
VNASNASSRSVNTWIGEIVMIKLSGGVVHCHVQKVHG